MGNAEEVRDKMRKKVRTIARMARMFKTLRQENETVIRLKGVCPGHKLAPGLLLAASAPLCTGMSARVWKRESSQRPVRIWQHLRRITRRSVSRRPREREKRRATAMSSERLQNRMAFGGILQTCE